MRGLCRSRQPTVGERGQKWAVDTPINAFSLRTPSGLYHFILCAPRAYGSTYIRGLPDDEVVYVCSSICCAHAAEWQRPARESEGLEGGL